MLRLVLPMCLVISAAFSCPLFAEDWPGWRGPRGDGSSSEAKVPVQWSEEDFDWKVKIPGVGHSSPIIWGERIFLLSCLEEEQKRILISLDREKGKILWQKNVLDAPLEKKHRLNSYASSTPLTDGKLVYVTFLDVSHSDEPQDRKRKRGQLVVAAYDFDGKKKWEVRPGPFSSVHGFCTSPILFQDMIIVNGDHDGDSYIAALDRNSGKEIWKVKREHRTRSYVTPIIRKFADGRTQMILSGSKCVTSYDPRDGSLHWSIDGPTEQFVASLVDNGKYVFLTAGFPERHILCIRPDGKGNVTDSHIVWRTKKNCSYVPSPIVIGDYFLVAADDGICSCYDAESGERIWFSRLGDHYSASLVSANGLAYFTADSGTVKVIKPGRELNVVAENKLGEECYASPAISEGQIFFRGVEHLFCIGKRVKSSK